MRWILPALLALLLVACVTRGGDASQPVPTALVPAPAPAQRLVVVLPGRGDDLGTLQQRGYAARIQQEWPDADVLLTGLTMPYYRAGQATLRLHDEIVAPARARGREVWLLGISLGGMGALLYEREHPGEVDGLLLLSPYLGEEDLHARIRDAGGLSGWDPGPERAVAGNTFRRELWRVPKRWLADPGRARHAWLAYGEDEPFRVPAELMAPALPDDHVLRLPGRHDWRLWTTATGAILRRADVAAP